MQYVIEVRDLKKSYGKVQAVKGISFEVKSGSMFAFLGPNGAGKSTTIDALCTLTKYDEGQIEIAGFSMDRNPEKIRQSIGVVFQDSVLDRNLSIKDNLSLRAGFYYHNKKQIQQAVREAAEYAEVTEFLDRPYGRLSGGQRRRADIARALLNTPQILILDEPTTGLDPQTRQHVWATIRRLQKEKNMTIFLTTHYMEEAVEADQVVIMDHGEIVAKGTPYELKCKYAYDRLRIKAKNEKKMEKYLNGKGMKWEKRDEILDVRVENTMDLFDLITPVKDQVESLEAMHGTMDDVFLNITGRKIRE